MKIAKGRSETSSPMLVTFDMGRQQKPPFGFFKFL